MTRPSRLCALLLTPLAAMAAAFLQDTDRIARDQAVYAAVLASGRGERAGIGDWARIPSPAITLDRTLAMCGSGPAPPPTSGVGCVPASDIASFETRPPGSGGPIFGELVDTAERRELADAFRARNARGLPFPAEQLEGVRLIAPDAAVRAVGERVHEDAGVTSFSLPAYSSRGRALVYASFTCGPRCGHGRLLLLDHEAGAWRVVAVHLVSIS